jgi:hypothetical protein
MGGEGLSQKLNPIYFRKVIGELNVQKGGRGFSKGFLS